MGAFVSLSIFQLQLKIIFGFLYIFEVSFKRQKSLQVKKM